MAQGSFNTSSVFIPIAPVFTERRFTYSYFSMQDVFKQIGGINAFIKPFFGALGPFLVFYFLYMLSVIMIENNEVAF